MSGPFFKSNKLVERTCTIAVACIGLCFFLNEPSAAAERLPPPSAVVWLTASPTMVVSPSQTATISLTFEAQTCINDGLIVVLSPVAQWIRPGLTLIGTIQAGAVRQVNLTIRPGAAAKLGSYAASVYILTQSARACNGGAIASLSAPLQMQINVWNQVVEPVSGVRLQIPPLDEATRVVADTSVPGQTQVDVETQSGTQGSYITQLGLIIYPNPQKLSLTQWFAQNVDIDGILAANGTFQNQTVNGAVEFVSVGQMPDAYLQLSGPVNDAYTIAAPSGDIVSVSQSQIQSLASMGYSPSAVKSMELQMLSTVQF